ncbi:LOW QUALITY PROTEIN: hypothetical protein CVT26_001108 [Gymnopilus dilepis]|uniref:Secreted protein n=1 Tax=Gymnopilus dilepis TaxID=231916 RepID=A0A409W7F2_9AGAR|nr:LOW QUALITY PROTEIN: hypothetical protein CVT26_001108 [Gymnopilus dilepis]
MLPPALLICFALCFPIFCTGSLSARYIPCASFTSLFAIPTPLHFRPTVALILCHAEGLHPYAVHLGE